MLVLYAKCKSVKALAQRLDENQQILYDLKSGKTQDISGRVANKIFLVFPDISEAWLLRGEGEMLKKSSSSEAETIAVPVDILRLNLNLTETIRQQQETIQMLTEMLNQRQGTKKENVG
jgi:hypothetical protein